MRIVLVFVAMSVLSLPGEAVVAQDSTRIDRRSIAERAPVPFGEESISGPYASEGVDEEWSGSMERGIGEALADDEGWPGSTGVSIECRTTVCGVVLTYENLPNPNVLIRGFLASLRERFGTTGIQSSQSSLPGPSGASGYIDVLIARAR